MAFDLEIKFLWLLNYHKGTGNLDFSICIIMHAKRDHFDNDLHVAGIVPLISLNKNSEMNEADNF